MAAALGPLSPRRALAGQVLFTDIDVGISDHALDSGGPPRSGPSTQAFSVFWGVRGRGGRALNPPKSNTAKPGSCDFGPDLTLVGTRVAGKLCKDWHYELPAGGVDPPNLWLAMLERRRRGRGAPRWGRGANDTALPSQ